VPGRGDLVLGERTLIMGIVNVTPDSFSDGGDFLDPDAAVEQGLRMVEDGADLVDVGGESTRPGSAPVSAEEEQRRVLPVIERLAGELPVPVSVDTRRGATARRAIEAGASVLNDVFGLIDPESREVAAATGVPVILMHMRGTPADMRRDERHYRYGDLMAEVIAELAERIEAVRAAGVAEESILVDPGIGFAKRAAESFQAVRRIPELARLGRPIVVGPSRKSFLAEVVAGPPKDRLFATLGAVAACVAAGAHVVRVHDVRPAVEAVRAFEACRSGPLI
jgi:dihydropteroate synthase